MATRRKRTTRKKSNGGHPFLLLLFFICLITGSAYVTDRMTNAPDAQVNVAAVRHIFNDKEMQGLVPKEDQGTPESLKEKIKAAFGKIVTIEMKSGDKTVVASADAEEPKEETQAEEKSTINILKETKEEAKEETKEETAAEETKEEKKDTFDLSRLFSSKDTKEEKVETTEAPIKEETKAETPSVSDVVKSETPKTVESAPAKSNVSSATKVEAPKATAQAKAKSETPAAKAQAKAEVPKAKTLAPAKTNTAVTGRLVVVIDDAGRDLASQKVYENMGIPLTLAVMPNQVHTREAAMSWHAKGLPVILHQPMESVSGIGMENKVILTSMSDAEIRSMLKNSLSQVPEAIGINNHQGSKATTDKRTMEAVMSELSHRGLFFFDSRTNSTTAADSAAKTYGVRYARNDLFVDNSADVNDICRMIREGAERAKKHGTYIIIGHCRPNTAEAFRQMVPKLQAEGIEFRYLSSVEG